MKSTFYLPKNRWLIGFSLGAIALTGASAYYAFSQIGQPPAQPVVSTPVIKQVTALGRLEPAAEVIRLAVPVALDGDRVLELRIQEGQTVKVGQIVAVLDSRDRLQDELRQAQAQVKLAEAKLAQINASTPTEVQAQRAELTRLQAEQAGTISTQQAEINRWQSEVRTARAEFNRFQQLYREGAISASVLDDKRLTLETAAAQLRQATAQLSRSDTTLQAQRQAAQANLDRIVSVRPVDQQAAKAELAGAIATAQRAETDLEKAYIRSPINGQILKVHTRPGEKVSDAGIADLGQTQQMYAVAEVYQTDIGKIKVGQSATITGQGFAGKLPGQVAEIAPQVTQQNVFSQQPGENLDRRVVEVKVRLAPAASQRVAQLTNLQVQVFFQP
ncbi:MAG: HlyD family efflux transporter periplasmic adaptor subunit [Aphanocapsa sp. GSE-SYN-MK-11-07L]|jgi:HlyD family secretion protein|nr:HlyD family efflux transporter periplasmic adaptor subunit [Aphanocapsa sp. GSE-SYN-MK-11-07L]